MEAYITGEQAIGLFIGATVVFGLAAWWADRSAKMADETVAEAINEDYNKTSENFKYQTPQNQEEAINGFRTRWKGMVSRARLEQFVVSLEEMRILCIE